MRSAIVTIFPDIFDSFLSTSLLSKAIERGLLSVDRIDPRQFGSPPHYHIDDLPYGGGAGMVMRPEPIAEAITKATQGMTSPHVIYLSPGGTPFSQRRAVELATKPELVFICGRYEGIDQRIVEKYVDEEISIGDYVTMGGEVPAMVILEAIVRLIPGVIGNSESLIHESFAPGWHGGNFVEAPQYTRPEVFDGIRVPEILLSGNHAKIEAWRLEQAKTRTAARSKQ